MLHTLLVTATDLERWADLLEGKSTFPELLRRLIEVSPGHWERTILNQSPWFIGRHDALAVLGSQLAYSA
ncbi:hypothetical protein J0X19_22190 [Hymenobacter sp. BT186]|uniref:Uncharacterized protein n=1 Tax=Hymenobacter telluris TaxID=2816474 RepID=A0A939JFQ9_9BACT|nr:hypothetical protein [Hymenobacter telluris]MBO0360687.1 hypothetical protein [Hymenobacter telluris]MBW3376714.1 hypothetical protein [Hymenobacter norwichensis]